MSKTIVISQPYYFPWIGLLEQIRIADIIVHYDDVQYSKGHFQDRVQIKTAHGFKWLTVPKINYRFGQNINEVRIDNSKNWKKSQIDFLRQTFRRAQYTDDMLKVVESVFNHDTEFVSDLSTLSTMALADYFGLTENKQFYRASDLPVKGHGMRRVLDLVKHFEADRYITGMGALKYFDFNLMEENNVAVEFLAYIKKPYPQLYGNFNPYVSSLDLIANMGPIGNEYICSGTKGWREFIQSTEAQEYLRKMHD